MKKIVSMICVLAIMISVGACSKKPKEIELKKEEITLNVGDEEKLKYTLSPADAETEVEWESSDKKVAEVSDDGIVTAIAAGTCTITVTTSNGLEAECSVIVEKDYCKIVRDEIGTVTGVTYASDGSYIAVDTNPSDIDDYIEYDALYAISDINSILGLPDSLMKSMTSTTAMQGARSNTYGDITVTWTYHPDNGLEVIYEFSR